MKKLLLIIALCFLCFLTGCAPRTPIPPTKIDNVKRVMFMGSGGYTVFVEGKNKELVRYWYGPYDGMIVRLVEDCPKDKKMWVDIDPQPNDNTRQLVTIHIHDASEINGGNTGGKNPNQINPIE